MDAFRHHGPLFPLGLYDVARGHLQKAEIGYRVGQRHNGRGYATAAVALALAEAYGRLGLHRVEAFTAPALQVS